jgi:hypothetical protein
MWGHSVTKVMKKFVFYDLELAFLSVFLQHTKRDIEFGIVSSLSLPC